MDPALPCLDMSRAARRILLIAVCVSVSVYAGCATPTALQLARTVPEQKAQAGLALEIFDGPDVWEQSDTPRTRRQLQLELFARKGMSSWSDCGGRLFIFGVKAECKVQVFKTRRLDLAVAPGVGYTTSFLSAHMLDGYLQALLGINLGAEPYEIGAVSLVGSVTPIVRCFVAEGRPSEGCYGQLAYSGGLAIQITPSFGVHAEAAWMRFPFATPPNFGLLTQPSWQFGLAGTAIFDAPDPAARSSSKPPPASPNP